MITLALIILLSLTIIGFVAVWVISKKKKEKGRSLWMKYYSYLFLLSIQFIAIYFGKSTYISFLILVFLLGFIELFCSTYSFKRMGKIVVFSNYFLSAAGIILLTLFIDIKWVVLNFLIVVIFDAFSQIGGELLGKTKITKISPNKTFEGICIGFLVSVLIGLIVYFKTDCFSLSLTKFITTITLICLFSFLGDLMASFVKRKSKIKDFSKVLSSHGGVLDRYDSLLGTGILHFILIVGNVSLY